MRKLNLNRDEVMEQLLELLNSYFYVFTNDVYVVVKAGRNSIRYSIGDGSKELFSDLGIDRILFNALMHCAVNTGLYKISNLR